MHCGRQLRGRVSSYSRPALVAHLLSSLRVCTGDLENQSHQSCGEGFPLGALWAGGFIAVETTNLNNIDNHNVSFWENSLTVS